MQYRKRQSLAFARAHKILSKKKVKPSMARVAKLAHFLLLEGRQTTSHTHLELEPVQDQ